MTKFYCSKCKARTDTINEEWDEERRLLSGECSECGKFKVTCTGTKGTIKKKSAKKLEEARRKRHERTLNRKAKELGRQILDVENKKKIKKPARKDLEA